jgi:TolB-like protein/class 3 adenylate cyclase
MAEQRVQRRLAAILAADVVGYSRLMERDETGTLARLMTLRQQIVDPAIAAYAGRMVKLMGDVALVEFASAVDAVTCAIEIQKSVREHNASGPEDRWIQFRIGINVGDIIVEGDDIYGDGVNVAARIEALAEPGGIFISRAAAEQVRDKLPIRIEKRGDHQVKNIARSIEVFCVVSEEAPATASSTSPSAARASALVALEKPSIAVLAFNNMSGDAEQEYFSDGISEDIITDLSKVSELHVIARNSSFVYKHQAVSVPDAAKTLGVRYVLEGSVRKAGNRVRVTAQLIDSITGGHVWASRYDRDLTDIFAVQDELTQEIVAALKVKLTSQEQVRLTHGRSVDIAAYELFLRGREQSWVHTRTGNIAAHNLLGRALAIDPGYVAAHARIAFIHVIDYANGWTEAPNISLQTGLDIAQKAVAMDPEEPDGHIALAVACMWNRELERALAEAGRCLALLPNSAEGHLATAHAQIFFGDAAAALERLDAYMRLDPLYPDIALYFLAEARFSLGEFLQAAAALDQRLERNPQSETSYALLASCYGHLGRLAESRAAWKETLRINPSFSLERRERILPFKNPADYERRVQGLRLAGCDVP